MTLNPTPNPTPPVVPFQEDYPVEFSLFTSRNEAVLYIGDPGETLRLVIKNRSAFPISIPAFVTPGFGLPPPVGKLVLCFRPGILDDVGNIQLKASGWTLEKKTDPQGVVSFSFTYKPISGSGELVLKPDEFIKLELQNVTALAGGGSRDTTVELAYQNLQIGSQTGKKLLPNGARRRHFTILNHQGARNIPLHVGFVGSNRVLNDGISRSSLKLRVANTMSLDPANPQQSVITLQGIQNTTPAGPGGRPEPSRLILSFTAGGSEVDWALGTDSQVQAIKVNDFGVLGSLLPAPAGSAPSLKGSGSPPSAQWKTAILRAAANGILKGVDINWKAWAEKLGERFELTLEPLQPVQLKAGEYFELVFSDILTGHPGGMTDLEILYKNIPGYWDGEFVCPIEKTQVIQTDAGIGIGTTNPTARLTVNGRIKDQSGYLLPVGTIVAYAGKIPPEGWLLCDGKAIPLGDRFKDLKALIGNNTPNMSAAAGAVYIIKY